MMKFSALRGHVCLVAAFLCLLAPPATTALGQTVVATIPTSNPPGAVDVDPIAGRLYIPFQNQILVSNENSNQVIHTITVGLDLEAVAVDPLTSRLYAADPFQGLLYVIDTKTYATVSTITIPYARTVAVNTLTNRIYVSNSFYVFVIDGSTNQTLTLISLDGARGLAINPMTNRIFVAQDVYLISSHRCKCWRSSCSDNPARRDSSTRFAIRLSGAAAEIAFGRTARTYTPLPRRNSTHFSWPSCR